MKNSEILTTILKNMEETHINLYHSVSKAEVEKYVSSLKNLDTLDDISFDGELLKFFNIFKDAHTSYYIPYRYLDKQLFFIENKVLLKHEGKYKEVLSIGNMPIDCFIKNIAEMQNYETQEFLFDCIRGAINNQYYYQMLGLSNANGAIECIVKNYGKQESVIINGVSLEEYKRLALSPNTPYYSCKTISNEILYIKYRKCSEYENYPFSQFVEELKQEIENKGLTQYILDLRGNHGGNSSIIKPLVKIIKKLSLDGVVLIDNGVFSSGRWAVADFKKTFNTLLIGEPTGGAATSYGNNRKLKVGDKNFSVSVSFFDFSKIFGSQGSIQPDILVPQTIDDLKNGKDKPLDVAVSYLEKKMYKEPKYDLKEEKQM